MNSDDRKHDAAKPLTPPEGRPAISRMWPSSSSAGNDGPRSSVRGSGESETFGRISRIMAWMDANKGGFAISRLISQTGVNLRAFTAETKDDAKALSKIWPVLDVMLSEEERKALMKSLRE